MCLNKPKYNRFFKNANSERVHFCLYGLYVTASAVNLTDDQTRISLMVVCRSLQYEDLCLRFSKMVTARTHRTRRCTA
jgi:hypothetical protein